MHSNYPHPLIAKEGWPFLAIALVLAALVTWFVNWWALPFWLAALFVLQFFRDPGRTFSGDENAVCSPADGRIVSVDNVDDPYTGRASIKISVFMNVFNVHSNRSPVDGEVIAVDYHPGSFVNAALDKASENNERNALRIRLSDGREVTCVQIAGLIARRILCYVKPGDPLSRGQRFGFIRFGSRVDLYLSPDARARVSIGDKVYAGESILAELQAAPDAQ